LKTISVGLTYIEKPMLIVFITEIETNFKSIIIPKIKLIVHKHKKKTYEQNIH